MDRHTAKPGWNLTLWALAGFLIVALAVYMAGGKSPSDVMATETSALS